jgi:hypothetical protein
MCWYSYVLFSTHSLATNIGCYALGPYPSHHFHFQFKFRILAVYCKHCFLPESATLICIAVSLSNLHFGMASAMTSQAAGAVGGLPTSTDYHC